MKLIGSAVSHPGHLKEHLHLFAAFQPVTPNIPGWAEPIEPGLGELYGGSDQQYFRLLTHLAKHENFHEI